MVTKGAKKIRRVLALDLGTQLGWALLEGSSLSSGEVCLAPRRNEGPGMRLVRFRKFLDEIGDVDALYYESVNRHIGTQAAHVYGSLEGRLQEWCEDRKIAEYCGIPVTKIKKHATGKGNADKHAMIDAAKERWPDQQIGEREDNRADALWTLDCALNS